MHHSVTILLFCLALWLSRSRRTAKDVVQQLEWSGTERKTAKSESEDAKRHKSLSPQIASTRITSKRAIEVERVLPAVMERLVMAVQSGLDIVPAVKVVVDLERELRGESPLPCDPVTAALSGAIEMCENGLAFDAALNHTAQAINCPSLKHAFLHLSLAHREGGELITPVRELSDSTFSRYQDLVEEDIAKLPVKATLPLILTFAGLLVCLLTPALLQIVEVSQKSGALNG